MFIGIGKKKNSIAKIFIKESFKKRIKINNIDINYYFNKKLNYKLIFRPLYFFNSKNFNINIFVSGGGKPSQIIAIQNGLSKALLKYNKNFKKLLSDCKMLTRDSRVVERKKIGKHKSRRSRQFSKR